MPVIGRCSTADQRGAGGFGQYHDRGRVVGVSMRASDELQSVAHAVHYGIDMQGTPPAYRIDDHQIGFADYTGYWCGLRS